MEDCIRDEECGEEGAMGEEHHYMPPVPPPQSPVKKTKKKRKKRSRISMCLTMCKYPLIWNIVREEFGWSTVEEDEAWNIFWTDMSVSTERAMKMGAFQRINHFPGMSEIARKNSLARNLNRISKAMPDPVYSFYPKTWILPADAADLHKQAADKKVRTYICKPSKGCQGNGIFLTRNLDDIDPNADVIVQR